MAELLGPVELSPHARAKIHSATLPMRPSANLRLGVVTKPSLLARPSDLQRVHKSAQGSSRSQATASAGGGQSLESSDPGRSEMAEPGFGCWFSTLMRERSFSPNLARVRGPTPRMRARSRRVRGQSSTMDRSTRSERTAYAGTPRLLGRFRPPAPQGEEGRVVAQFGPLALLPARQEWVRPSRSGRGRATTPGTSARAAAAGGGHRARRSST